MSFQMPTKLTSRFLVRPEYGSARSFDFNQNSHTLTIPTSMTVGSDASTALVRVKKAAISVLTTAETTLFTMPASSLILDVIFSITDASAEANTINIGTDGTSNDPDGFFAVVPTNATGLFSAMAGNVNAVTVGLNETYRSGNNLVGALLTKAYQAGTDLTEDTGIFVPKPYFLATADPVTYTLSGTTTSFAASVTVLYVV